MLLLPVLAALTACVSTPASPKITALEELPELALTKPIPMDHPRVAVLDMGLPGSTNFGNNVVGINILASDWKNAAQELRKLNTDIVIIRANARCWSVEAAQEMSNIIIAEYLPNFRVILWLEQLDGFGTVALWVIPEIVMRPNALLGPALAFFSCGVPGYVFDSYMHMGERASAISDRDPAILKSMMYYGVGLSFDVDPMTCTPVWKNSTSGQYVLSNQDTIMFWNAASATRCGVAVAQADNLNELYENLKLSNVELVGATVAMQLHQTREEVHRYDLTISRIASNCAMINAIPAEDRSQIIRTINDNLETCNQILKQYPNLRERFDPNAVSCWLQKFQSTEKNNQ